MPRMSQSSPPSTPLETVLVRQGFRLNDSHPVTGGQPIKAFYTILSGIYVLEFADGQAYVGKAVDVVKRYAQHLKTYSDIATIHFKPIVFGEHKHLLDEAERTITAAVEAAGVPLRNIQNVTYSTRDVAFDEIMSKAQQAEWLTNIDAQFYGDAPPIDEKHRISTAKKFEKLMKHPFADDAIFLAAVYLRKTIPAPEVLETTHWAVSCMPSYNYVEDTVMIRFNLGRQMTFDICFLNGLFSCSWYLTRTLAAKGLSKFLPALSSPEEQLSFDKLLNKKQYLAVEVDNELQAVLINRSELSAGGADQVHISAIHAQMAQLILWDDTFNLACRQFNLGLMQKSRLSGQYAKLHCPDLADLFYNILWRMDGGIDEAE